MLTTAFPVRGEGTSGTHGTALGRYEALSRPSPIHRSASSRVRTSIRSTSR